MPSSERFNIEKPAAVNTHLVPKNSKHKGVGKLSTKIYDFTIFILVEGVCMLRSHTYRGCDTRIIIMCSRMIFGSGNSNENSRVLSQMFLRISVHDRGGVKRSLWSAAVKK